MPQTTERARWRARRCWRWPRGRGPGGAHRSSWQTEHMSWALTFIGIIILIVVHELGHFAVAKAVGMRVERFSLFFPPKLVGVRFGETEYMIGAIPLGGYVKIAGMAPLERVPGRASGADADAPARHAASASGPRGIVDEDDPRGYFSQPVWKRMAVIAAGPAMNVLMAFLILWGVYAFSAYKPATAHQARVAAVLPGSAAAGVLRRGDEIIAGDGHPVRLHGSSASVVSAVAPHRCAGAPVEGCPAATPVRLTIERGGRSLTVSLRPRYNAKEGRMLVGFDFLAAQRKRQRSDGIERERDVARDHRHGVEDRRNLHQRKGACAAARHRGRLRGHQRSLQLQRLGGLLHPCAALALAGDHQPLSLPAPRRGAPLLGACGEGARQGDPLLGDGTRLDGGCPAGGPARGDRPLQRHPLARQREPLDPPLGRSRSVPTPAGDRSPPRRREGHDHGRCVVWAAGGVELPRWPPSIRSWSAACRSAARRSRSRR